MWWVVDLHSEDEEVVTRFCNKVEEAVGTLRL